MELLLNLAWLLLVLPAYWLWRGSSTATRRFRPSQSLLALGCMLVILFPVVSATDDLRAMRAEMEESPTSKRSVSQSGGEKSSTPKSASQPALIVALTFLPAGDWTWRDTPLVGVTAAATTLIIRASRAPPDPNFA